MKSAKKTSLKSEFTLSKRSSRRSTAQCENFKLGLTEVPPGSPWILTFLIFYLKVNYKVSSLRDNDSKQKTSFQLSRDFSKCKISVLGPGFTSDVTSLTYWSKLSKCLFYVTNNLFRCWRSWWIQWLWKLHDILYIYIVYYFHPRKWPDLHSWRSIVYSWTWDLKRKSLAWNDQNSIWAYESVHNLFGNNGFLIPFEK